MGEVSGSTGRGPRKRPRLPRQRQAFRCDFRHEVYRKLESLAQVDQDGRREPLIAVLERLVLDAESKRDTTH